MRRPMTARALGVCLLVLACCGADGDAGATADRLIRLAARAGAKVIAWYDATPPAERIPTGGLAACAVLAALTLLGRTFRLRRRRVIPPDFLKRFKDRMEDVRLDRGKVLDLCELNPSPASRVALASVKRWGRPTVDLEPRHVDGRSPGVGRAPPQRRHPPPDRGDGPVARPARQPARRARSLNAGNLAWGPAIASALGPLTAGVAMAILSLVAYDGLMGRVEKLVGDLEKLAPRPSTQSPWPSRRSRRGRRRPRRIRMLLTIPTTAAPRRADIARPTSRCGSTSPTPSRGRWRGKRICTTSDRIKRCKPFPVSLRRSAAECVPGRSAAIRGGRMSRGRSRWYRGSVARRRRP